MYGHVEGYAENDDVKFCPYCGSEMLTKKVFGSSYCENSECGKEFYVIENDDETFGLKWSGIGKQFML